MKKGSFIEFYLPYMKDGAYISSRKQAKRILKEAKTRLENGAKGVAITYSANYDQTRKINKVYQGGGWSTETNGANQASVVAQMEQLLGERYTQLQGRMHIAPITTMNGYDEPLVPWNGAVLLKLVENDLEQIEKLLRSGWDVLGWQNQDTITKDHRRFAVGGGVASIPDGVSEVIQGTLSRFSREY